MKYLKVKDVIYINEEVIKASGGSLGIRDFGLIDSAVNRARASFGGEDLYVSVFEKAASIFHSIILNHAFIDGNKRTAVASAALFLYINGYEVDAEEKELEIFTLRIIIDKLEIEEIANWLEKNSKKK